MITDSEPKSAAMVQQRRKDSKAERQAVLATIAAMERTRTPITVAEVARRARVSPWLVRQEPLMTAVRKAQTGSAAQSPAPGETNTSSASLQVERDLLRQENQRLRYEIRRSLATEAAKAGCSPQGSDDAGLWVAADGSGENAEGHQAGTGPGKRAGSRSVPMAMDSSVATVSGATDSICSRPLQP